MLQFMKAVLQVGVPLGLVKPPGVLFNRDATERIAGIAG